MLKLAIRTNKQSTWYQTKDTTIILKTSLDLKVWSFLLLFQLIVSLLVIYSWKQPLLFLACVVKETLFSDISNHLVSLFALSIAWSD